MQLGMIGLGRMGGNMAKRIAAAGHEVVGFDRSPELDRTVSSLEEMVASPEDATSGVGHGSGWRADRQHHQRACRAAGAAAMIIDGGNSVAPMTSATRPGWSRRASTSWIAVFPTGGVWGINRGYALMVGGNKDDFETARPIFEHSRRRKAIPALVLAGPVGGLRQDGAQRHRIRYDAGLRRGLRHHGEV